MAYSAVVAQNWISVCLVEVLLLSYVFNPSHERLFIFRISHKNVKNALFMYFLNSYISFNVFQIDNM